MFGTAWNGVGHTPNNAPILVHVPAHILIHVPTPTPAIIHIFISYSYSILLSTLLSPKGFTLVTTGYYWLLQVTTGYLSY